MYVSEFQLDSFGGGPPLRFLDLGNSLNVALTTSEDGALQLLQVVPATLFGDEPFFSELGSDSLHSGLGTSLMLRTEDGALRVSRRWDTLDAAPAVTTSDEHAIAPGQWDALLAKIRPTEYADVFTFDVEHLQRTLRSRRQTIRAVERLARQLADASVLPRRRAPASAEAPPLGARAVIGPLRSGLERLESLVEQAVQPEAATMVAAQPRPPVTDDELNAAERDYRQLLDQLSESELDWKRSVAAQTWLPLRDRLRDLERQQTVLERQPRSADVPSTTPQAIERLDERIATHREEWKAIRLERQEIHRQFKELDQHQAHDQLMPQVEALMLQQKPLVREEDSLDQLRNQLEDLESRADLERSQPTAFGDERAGGITVDAATQARFDHLSDRLREAERERELAEQQVGRAESAVIAAPVTTATAPVDSVTIHQAQQRVQQLREQSGWHDDFHEIQRKRRELQQQVRQLYAGRLLPMSTVLLFGVPFAVGIGLIIHAVFTAQNGLNWNQTLWGFVLTLVSVVIKIIRDRERSELLLAARRKLARLDERLQAAGDGVAPEDGALAAELRAAEQELAELESQLPEASSARHPAVVAGPSVEAVRRRAQQASQRCREMNQQWRELLIELDLSPSLTPAHAREALAERALRSRSETRPTATTVDVQIPIHRKELERRQDWLQQQIAAFQNLAKELGRPVYGNSISDVTDVLHEAIREARERRQQRAQWQRADQRLRQKEKTLRENGKRLAAQRRQLRSDWRRKQKQQQARTQRDEARQRTLEREIESLTQELERRANDHQLDPQLPPCTWDAAELSAKLSEQQQRMESLRDRVLAQSERRGRLRAQLEPEKPVDLPIAPPSESWQLLRQQARDLKQRLNDMESQLQATRTDRGAASSTSSESEYLITASQLLRRLSGGYFRRMAWQGRQLELTDRQGRRLDARSVKPAHFANIYFALWLTRLEQYADRGVRFPVVLDDPLRVTAEKRKRKVAAMLREFAATGHQMLLVTRDRQHARVFGHLGVPIADLSNREQLLATQEFHSHVMRHEPASEGIQS